MLTLAQNKTTNFSQTLRIGENKVVLFLYFELEWAHYCDSYFLLCDSDVLFSTGIVISCHPSEFCDKKQFSWHTKDVKVRDCSDLFLATCPLKKKNVP